MDKVDNLCTKQNFAKKSIIEFKHNTIHKQIWVHRFINKFYFVDTKSFMKFYFKRVDVNLLFIIFTDLVHWQIICGKSLVGIFY